MGAQLLESGAFALDEDGHVQLDEDGAETSAGRTFSVDTEDRFSSVDTEDRSLVVDSEIRAALVTTGGLMPQTVVKDPDAVLDYGFDWSSWLASGETIDSYTVTVTGATKDSDTESDGVVTVWVSAGAAGTEASVLCEIVTTDGRTDQRTMTLIVRSR